MRLIREDTGRIGYIVPNTFLLNQSSEKLRQHILDEWRIEQLINYGKIDIFDGATVRACQLHLRKCKPENDSTHSEITGT